MATLVDPDFRARLRELNEKYAANVPSLMRTIASALDACGASALAPADLAALHKGLHAIAGSGGTFGFAVLGQECRRLEHLLRDIVDGHGNGQPDAARWPELAAQVRHLLAWAAVNPQAPYFPALGAE